MDIHYSYGQLTNWSCLCIQPGKVGWDAVNRTPVCRFSFWVEMKSVAFAYTETFELSLLEV